jgi:hypothetical protein
MMNATGLYLMIAGLCLGLALRSLKQALVPIGEIVRAAAALAVVGLSVSAALVFLVAALMVR